MGLRLLNSVPCVARMLFLPTIVCNSPNDLLPGRRLVQGRVWQKPSPVLIGSGRREDALSASMLAILGRGGHHGVRPEPEVFEMVGLGGSGTRFYNMVRLHTFGLQNWVNVEPEWNP